MKSAILARSLWLCLLLVACRGPGSSPSDEALYNTGEQAVPLAPGVQPVRIGDGGADFAACSGRGTVVNLSPAGQADLPVRAAPFAEADEVMRLGNGATLLICTHSLDQQWQGVVVPKEGVDCGVGNPVDAPRAYTGPCRSGWVASAFVRVQAD